MKLKKLIRYGVRGLMWTGVILLILYVAIIAYIHFNKNHLIGEITAKIKGKTKSGATIGDLSGGFLQTFPFLSLHLSDVTIRDSLWEQHNKTFFSAKDIYVRINFFKILRKQSVLDKLLVENGKLHLLSDSTGYNNQYILKSDKPEEENKSIPDIVLKKTEIIFENQLRYKLHHLYIHKLVCDNDGNKDFRRFNINTDLLVNGLAFNTQKGSYLKHKSLKGKFQLAYNSDKKELSFSNILLLIDRERFNVTGNFSLDTSLRDYKLTIRSEKNNFQKTVTLLPENIHSKLKAFIIEKPVTLLVNITGKTQYRSIPLVHVDIHVNNNIVTTPIGTVTDCSFTGEFTNEVIRGEPRNDSNSSVRLKNFSAGFEKIPFSAKQITINNLKTPQLEFDLKSTFDLKSLNELTGSSTIQFSEGTGAVNILFKGPIGKQDSSSSAINGYIKINNATIQYLPRNFIFSNCSGKFLLRKNDLHIEQFAGRTGDTELQMNGDASNFLSLLDMTPEKLTLQWKVYSPHLHLNDFKTFLDKKKTGGSSKKDNAKFSAFASRIDRMLTDGDMFLKFTTPRLNYKNFVAENINAQVLFTKNRIEVKNTSLHHANGSMLIDGSIAEESGNNAVVLNTKMNKMHIPALFYAFDNFGQDAVTHKNLKGIVSATAHMNIVINRQAKIITQSMTGTIDFLVEKGELNHFEPLENISASVFKNQDFSSIRFADLKNRLEVKGTAIMIDKMEIRSTALVLFAEGIYDVKKGTDMSIKFPIRNMLKKNDSINLSTKNVRYGLSVHVRAKTGEDGKLKISWDPFKKSIKNKKESEALR